jgi:predicted PurR-regulated permease PerM
MATPPAAVPPRRPDHEGPSTATIFRIVFTVLAALLVAYALYRVRAVLVLVFVAAFLAVGLDPAVEWLQKHGLKRGQAVGLMLGAFVIFLLGFIAAVIPPLVVQITEFATNFPDYVRNIAEKNPRLEEYVQENDVEERLRSALENAPTVLGGSVGKVVGVAGSIVGSVFSALTVIVLTIYFSLSLSKMREGSLRMVPATKRQRVKELSDPILEKVGGYIAGNVVISVIAGVLAFIFLLIAQVPFPVALALWVAIADLIPLVGATLGAVPAVIVAFFAGPVQGFATLIYFISYQQFENYVVAPRVMRTAVDISPAAVLLAALIGASLLGFVGALVAVPAAAAIKIIVEQVVRPRLEEM